MKQKQLVIIAIALLLGGFILGTMYYKEMQNAGVSQMAAEQKETFTPDYAPVIGPKDAKVTIVEFFDPACGTCAQFSPLLKEMVKKYEGKVRVVLRYAPLHQNSDYVVTMMEAVKMQGKYFEAKDALFAFQHVWVQNHVSQPGQVWAIFQKMGLDIEKLKQDVKDPEVVRRVQKDIADAEKLGASKTPTFFVNGKPLPSFGYKQLVTLVESEL